MIQKNIIYCGKPAVLSCDKRCDKAWGINTRPCIPLDPNNVDDYAYKADDELREAPRDPGTYEGADAKPRNASELLNKWCCRECERSRKTRPGEPVVLPDFSQRVYNIPRSKPA